MKPFIVIKYVSYYRHLSVLKKLQFTPFLVKLSIGRSLSMSFEITNKSIWRSLIFLTLFTSTVMASGESSEFRVALTGKYPPFSMYNLDGELVGFDVDISYEIARRLTIAKDKEFDRR